MKTFTPLLLSLLLSLPLPHLHAQTQPKREFRGAWIQCVNGQWIGMSPQQMRDTLSYQLDELQKTGINVILFQVRAEGDALYDSPYEPWSRFLTGQQGLPPSPVWDPLAWMVVECHKRGMELHAWINPFRAKTLGTPALTSPYYRQHPERFFAYGGLLIFDPALPENRRYICHIAADIVRRYDIDGLHIDDYFYPYPVAGVPIPDDISYRVYGKGKDRGDWRRSNVNAFIHALSDSIHTAKPWVKFGVSPFGIYRNASPSYPTGSQTHGLSSYDDLYADVLMWLKRGWVDYNIPQVYWEVGNKAADYETLLRWWDAHAYGRPLIIGQDVERTVKYPDTRDPRRHQLMQKMEMLRMLPNVVGTCQWYAKALVDNPQNYATHLRQTYYHYYSLPPLMPWIDSHAPAKPRGLRARWTARGYRLQWRAPKAKGEMDRAVRYVVYRYGKGEKRDLDDPTHIVAIMREPTLMLPYTAGRTTYTYVVTALDRLSNESKPSKIKLKL